MILALDTCRSKPRPKSGNTMDHAVEHNNTNGSGGYERSEANLKLIVYAALGLAATVFVVMLLMWGVFNVLKTHEQANDQTYSPLAAPFQLPPEPRLQEHPELELQELRRHEAQVLNQYQWSDQKSGIVHIPINRAMDLIAQRGLPYQKAGESAGVAPAGAAGAKGKSNATGK